jgi:hypothetical protein
MITLYNLYLVAFAMAANIMAIIHIVTIIAVNIIDICIPMPHILHGIKIPIHIPFGADTIFEEGDWRVVLAIKLLRRRPINVPIMHRQRLWHPNITRCIGWNNHFSIFATSSAGMRRRCGTGAGCL